MRRRRAPIALLLVVAAACVPAALRALNATEVRSDDAWSVTVPVAPERAYAVVLGVLSDSSYNIERGDAASGMIETRPRRDSDVRRASTVGYGGSNYPITLRAIVRAAGTDSSRIAIYGDYAIHNQTARISAKSAEWRYITGVGAAVLDRLGAPRP